jgi:tetratricopeptide (TPR) repeat protein
MTEPISRKYILNLLGWCTVAMILGVSDGFASQSAKRPGRDEMVVEPGDPEAYYDRGRRDWFVRPKALAEPEDGGATSRLSLSLLQSSTILPVNGPEVKALGSWASPTMDALERLLDSTDLDQPVIVAITLRPKGDPEFTIVAPEKLGAEARQKITQMLTEQTPPRPLFVDCHFAFVYHPKKMKAGNDPGIPASLYPSWRESREYQNAALPEKTRLLRKWCREQVIPLLAGAASQVEPKFEGVRAFGNDVLKLDPSGVMDVEKLTFRNPNFWRAAMEMAGGDMTITGCQVCLFTANGELGKAGRLLQFMPRRADGEHLASILVARLRGRIEDIEAATGKRIEEGIRLFERRQHEKAAAAFEAILKDNPASAWACHELLLTRMTMKRSDEVVKDYEAKVYGLDPLYPSPPIHVDTGERAYRALLRLGIREMFKDRSKGREDCKKYAQTALDLGEYGYAGLLYWAIFTGIDPGNDDALRHFLYCLEQLDVPQIKKFFKPECSAGFDQIERDQRQRMEEHPAYQAMHKKQ